VGGAHSRAGAADRGSSARAAVAELLGERSEPGPPDSHDVSVSAPDRATLLAEWISELAFLAETRAFVPERVDRLELGESVAEATVSGHRAAPPHLIKAGTYHRLGMWEQDETWRARVILDV
jgi:SHS2 domain-containing protein